MKVEQHELKSRAEQDPQSHRRSRRLRIAGAAAAAVIGLGVAAPTVASADPYPSADVQVGANIRACTSLTACPPEGTVGRDSNFSDTQRSWVKCYQDGDYATGNYYTNRWFQVYVTATGSSWAFWGYVHASYVYNQPVVGPC